MTFMFWVGVALLILVPSRASLADGEALIIADADATVWETRPEEPQSDRVLHILAAGLGRALKPGHAVSYVRFGLGALPTSTIFAAVAVSDARLSLMATSLGLSKPQRRFLVTVRSCDEIDWGERSITWKNQPCATGAESQTSIIIDGTDLPRAYEWDVARGVTRALVRGAPAVTFTVSAVPLLDCDRDPFEGIGCPIEEGERFGFVQFVSRERETYGIGAIPHFVVHHATEPTRLMRMIELTLSLLSAFALTFGVYRTVRGLFGPRGGVRD